MKIDFVVTWVDNTDVEWRTTKNFYAGLSSNIQEEQGGDLRYRDWGLLQYWFRGVEKFTPWVNKIHFVTYGHVPKWLNLNHPKLNIVKHKEFMKEEYLPTFNSCAIEINLHKIEGLAENFVYFNDDFFIINYLNPDNFFKNDLPCDEAVFSNYFNPTYNQHNYIHMLTTEAGVINQNFDFQKYVKKNKNKYLNSIYQDQLYLNEFYTKRYYFPGLYHPHLPQAFKKSTFSKVWDAEPEILNNVSKNKFRTLKDVCQYLMRTWQIMSGEFEPVYYRKIGFSFGRTDQEIERIKEFIEKQERSIIVINDSISIDNISMLSKQLKESFDKILKQKSSFEI